MAARIDRRLTSLELVLAQIVGNLRRRGSTEDGDIVGLAGHDVLLIKGGGAKAEERVLRARLSEVQPGSGQRGR